jgi:hypothetical protein
MSSCCDVCAHFENIYLELVDVILRYDRNDDRTLYITEGKNEVNV